MGLKNLLYEDVQGWHRSELNREYAVLAGAPQPQQEGGDCMAKLTVAEAPKPKVAGAGEQYISRTWLSKAVAPTADPAAFSGSTAKVFRIVSGNSRRHTILYIEDMDPNTKL